MITGYESFSLYQALKLHFTTKSYDFFKYGGKSKISVEAFENRKDKYYFYKLSRRLQTKEELIDFLVANFVHDENCWVGNLLDEQSESVYRQRQKVMQSLSYTFQNDCEKIFQNVSNPNEILQSDDGDYPKLLINALQKNISIETLCILNDILNFIPMWDKKISDTIRWPDYKRKIQKYSPFLQYDKTKFKFLLKRVVHEKVENIS
jgi:hypothetical protein